MAPHQKALDLFLGLFAENLVVWLVLAVTTCLFSLVFQPSDPYKSKSGIGSALGYLAFPYRRYRAWWYLFKGTDLIQKGYDTSNGKPYEILAPDTRYVFVSSPKHIRELDVAPDTMLSLQAASKQMLQPQYTMHGFNWFDRRGTEGVGFVRALRTMLTHNLPNLLPELGVMIKARIAEMHETSLISHDGNKSTKIYPNIVKIVVFANAFSFFGSELAIDELFMKYALAYIEETLICAEIVRLVPRFLVPVIGNIISRHIKSHEIIFKGLLPVAEERCRERDLALAGQSVPYHADCIQWIMETSPKDNPWTPKRIVHELMAIWFGSVHALSTTITFAIHDLCLHPEYVGPLREELQSNQYAEFEQTARGLPLLDSFVKESARLTPAEAQSTRRSALQAFTLSDGTTLNVGDWACTPVRAIMQDARYYPSPLEFNGLRFVNPKLLNWHESAFKVLQETSSRLIDANDTYHVWGTGRMACPGRYYAAAVIKVILAQIILHYDCELVQPEAPRWYTWRSSMLPKESTLVTFVAKDR